MSQDTNKVTLTGTIDSDVNVTYSNNGMCIAEFTLKMIGYQDREKFVPVKCFKERAEDAATNGGIGARVAIEGELDGRKWEKPDGSKTMVFMNVIAVKLSIETPASMGGPVGFGDDDEVPFDPCR
jgi:single-stranded DNA-binding protein